MSDAFKSTNVPIIQVPKKRGLLRYLWALRKTFIKEKVTIVHSQTPSNTLLLAIALWGTGIKVVTTFHGHSFADALYLKRKIVYAASKRIICVSEYQKRYYEEKWGLLRDNKLQVVYNGIDFTKVDSALEIGNWKLENDNLRLAMVGNFVKGRSQIVVAKALNKLKMEDERLKIDFYFIGRRDKNQPERYDECVKYCEENGLKNVHFLGSRNDVPAILKSIDGFVYSTEHDTFGIAVIEAIAAGLPVVVNDWAVMKEVCNLGLPGTNKVIRFFRTNDVEDCAEKIEELLMDIITNNKELFEQYQEASDAAKKKYAIENHINQLNTIYQSL